MSNNILVSIWMLTYNHEQYLEQALESILMQKRDFDLEIVIGDDLSTDNTRNLIRSYAERYPKIIKPILRDVNIGIAKNFADTWFNCKGKYIALLEGDDYWTDSKKLQKQINFLEANPEYTACYTKAKEINELTNRVKITNEDDNDATGLKELLSGGWFMRTGSIVARNNLFDEFPDFFYRYGSTDFFLHLLIAKNGPIKFIDEVTNVYRRHEGGITQDFQSKQIKFNKNKIELLREVDLYFDKKFTSDISKLVRKLNNSTAVQFYSKKNYIQTCLYFIKGDLFQYLKHRKKAIH